MRLPLTVVLSILGCSYLSQAAECYAQSGGPNCVAKAPLLAFGNGWCNANFDALQGGWSQFPDPAGKIADIGKIGVFPNAATCIEAYTQIVNQCFGQRNGGSWTWGGVSLNINFCQWQAQAVGFEVQKPCN
jgi:hypothetical protein